MPIDDAQDLFCTRDIRKDGTCLSVDQQSCFVPKQHLFEALRD